MTLRLHMLGEFVVHGAGGPLTLPPSRKLRALLAFLAMTPRPVPRHQLCELLWENTADPRAELRWHLSKLRSVLGVDRLQQDDDNVRLVFAEGEVDALEVQRTLRHGVASFTPARLRELLTFYRGEFLEELRLDHCPAFTTWLIAQRRTFRDWRLALIEQLALASGEDGLEHVEKWLQMAPLDVRAHQRLFDTLASRGRFREADEHLAVATRLFTAEGLDCGELRRVWRLATARRGARPSPRTDSQADEQAIDCYLRGRQQLALMTQRGLVESRRLFERAVELQPDYGPAWSGLATVQAYMHEWFESSAANLARAEQASRVALSTAPQLAEAHLARALVQAQLENPADAECEFEQAIRLNPYLFEAYYFYARAAFARGDMARAADMFTLAAQARPQDFQSPILSALPLKTLGREDAAREAIRSGLQRAELALAINPREGRALSLGAGALFDDGQPDRAMQWSRKSLALDPDDSSALVNAACLHAKAGEAGAALALLEKVFARGCGKRDWVVNDPDYSLLLPEPRFHRLLGRLR